MWYGPWKPFIIPQVAVTTAQKWRWGRWIIVGDDPPYIQWMD